MLSIIYQANSASDTEKNDLRKQLFDRLKTKYVNIKKYEFRQLHFHLPTTESFLRMHAPETYGDLLVDVRESVRLANATEQYVVGFEEGKIFNGFRYVYPLQFNENHIGSVEVSISSASILEVLSKLYPEEDFHFIMDKAVVDELVFDSEKGNYSNTPISEFFYIDKEAEGIIDIYNKIVPNSEVDFYAGVKSKYVSYLKNSQSFADIYKYNKKDYLIKFLSIENLKEQPVAYMISISETTDYQNLVKEMYKQMALVTVLAIILVLFGFVFTLFQLRLKNVSELDYLTKLYNRHKFYKVVEKEIKRSNCYKYSSSVLMLDIDYFKNVNDTYGHEWGDQVLKALAKIILKNMRDVDVFARWGGEEFVFLLPHTNKTEAIQAAEKIRRLVDESHLEKLKDITVSIGVAMIDHDKYDIELAIQKADEAMYQAKKNNRNQVCCYDESTS